MVKGEIRAAVQGLRRSTEKRNARAEMLGSDGGPQTRKPAPGGAVGLAGTEKSTQDLFRLKSSTGGWGLRRVAVAGCGAAGRPVGSASARAAAPGSLAGLPWSNGVG